MLYSTAPSCETVNITVGSTTVVTGAFTQHGFLRVLGDSEVEHAFVFDSLRLSGFTETPVDLQACVKKLR